MRNKVHLVLTLCILSIAFIPRALVIAKNTMAPFTNSVIAIAIETQRSGHIPSNPYTIQGFWQTHANFITSRGAPVLVLTILSYTTGLSPKIMAFFPFQSFLFVITIYLIGQQLGNRFTGFTFAMIFGFEWHSAIFGGSFGYQQYGDLLEFVIILILVRCCVNREEWSRKDILVVCLLFFVLYQTYYQAEFSILVLFLSMTLISLILKSFSKFNINSKSIAPIPHLALLFISIFFGLDIVVDSFIRSASPASFGALISNYFSYATSIIYGQTGAVQEFRPFTNPISKYVDLVFFALMWAVIVLCIGMYFHNLGKSKSNNQLSRKENLIHVIILSSLFVFGARFLIYGLMGIIAIYSWPIPVSAIVLAQIWFGPRFKSKLRLQYVIPLLLVCLAVFRFSVSFNDQTLSYVGANYRSIVGPSAYWIADYVSSGSVVSSNQASALVFSVVAERQKANVISVNEFLSTVENLQGDNASHLHQVLVLRGYNYLLLLKLFETQPVYGGLWGPWSPPLGTRLNNLSNAPGFLRIYDNGMSTVYQLELKRPL